MKSKFLFSGFLIFFIWGCGAKNNSQESISLFNGRNLDGWYTFIARPDSSIEIPGLERGEDGQYTGPVGINKDPLQVFGLADLDGEKVIRISGQVMGILVTEKEYENYHLKLEFRWGEKKYPPRERAPRDSGLLYNSIGREGAWYGVWMKSVECQINEKEVGDLYTVDTVFVDVPAVIDPQTGRYAYSKGAEKKTFSPEISHCGKDVDYEKPVGEWNTVEVYTVNGRSVHVINGQVNNRLENFRYLVDGEEVPLTRGKIQLQSEGAEIFYRNITLTPIREIPHELM
ncbi:MAG TPA: DUF1080 domain-containing protein [Cyclobacteriaceae bacterium]|nr:DUF1080 domain-containing protein [Cyclobacteriaceae bacterium]